MRNLNTDNFYDPSPVRRVLDDVMQASDNVLTGDFPGSKISEQLAYWERRYPTPAELEKQRAELAAQMCAAH